MKIISMDSCEYTEAYNILCKQFLKIDEDTKAPFGSMMGVISKGDSSFIHNHHEIEVVFIIAGSGEVKNGKGSNRAFEENDLIYMDPFENHELKADEYSDVKFISFYWEDKQKFVSILDEKKAGTKKSYVVLTPPPTPNGDLHLGHLSGPYLGADLFCRFQKMNGNSALYLSGSDDNQSYVRLKALQNEKSPAEVADYYSSRVRDAFSLANFDIDGYQQPQKDEAYSSFVRAFFLKLHKDGAFEKKSVEQPFCHACNTFISEAFVRGYCPTCGSASDGNSCEACGFPNDCGDLVNAKCRLCDGDVENVVTEKLYFPLTKFGNELRAYFESAILPAHLKSLCYKLVDNGLPDIAVTQHTSWGIDIPIDGFEGQKIYVWFEMAAGMLAQTIFIEDENGERSNWESIWKSKDRDIVQFMGFDNGYYYAVLVPAILLAYDKEINLPTQFLVNEFYNLEGLKFSTSRNHAIWGNEFLKEHKVDVVRFYLSYSRPETFQTSFKLSEYLEFVEQVLVGDLTDRMQELQKVLEEKFDATACSTGGWSSEHKQIMQYLINVKRNIAVNYSAEGFSARNAAHNIVELIARMKRFSKGNAWLNSVTSLYDEYRTAVALELAMLRLISEACNPIMPEFSKALSKGLGLKGEILWSQNVEFVPSGNRIKLPVGYFVENEVVGVHEKEMISVA